MRERETDCEGEIATALVKFSSFKFEVRLSGAGKKKNPRKRQQKMRA